MDSRTYTFGIPIVTRKIVLVDKGAPILLKRGKYDNIKNIFKSLSRG